MHSSIINSCLAGRTFNIFAEKRCKAFVIAPPQVKTVLFTGHSCTAVATLILAFVVIFVFYCRKIHQLIQAMTSRFPAEALRPNSSQVAVLKAFLIFIDKWEDHTKGNGGFMSNSTATGLRVTISSTLELLTYVTGKLKYKYLMTSRLCQDPLENLFGIIRQSSGSNEHPTPTQFLIVVNCLSFYGLVKCISQGNCEDSLLASLLDVGDKDSAEIPERRMPAGTTVKLSVDQAGACHDHSQHIVKSDSRLVFHIAGYVARKCVMKAKCESCISLLTMPATDDSFQLARYTRYCDRGGLIYPSAQLYDFVLKLENLFTECFSQSKLHAESIFDVLDVVRARLCKEVGCHLHAEDLSKEIVKFYIVARLHFFVKGVNTERPSRRERAKHLKLSRS